MSHPNLIAFLYGIGLGVAPAWVVEAMLVGFGVVSTYLAPVAIVAIVAAGLLRRK